MKNYVGYRKLRVGLIEDENVKDEKICKVSSAESVYNKMKDEVKTLDREHIFVLCLDHKLGVIGINTVSIGTKTSCQFSPADLMKPVLLSNSTGIIIMHNHPSGDCKPSESDIRVTGKIKNACEIFEIKLYDHIILSGESFYSMADNGQV